VNRFDVIVIGAGPAGTTAAYLLAKEGMRVVLVERGEAAGAKNVFGGVLWCASLNKIIPDFWEEAPLERAVVRKGIFFLTEDASFSLDFFLPSFGVSPYNGFTIIRQKFDPWYVEKAKKEGAIFVPMTLVENIIFEDKRAVGVRTERKDGDLFADVVIIADGANSLLAKRAGLRREYLPEELALGVKEVLELPPEVIEERFQLSAGQGAALEFVGWCTKGMQGGGFLYTNEKSLSLGIVVSLSALCKKGSPPYDLLNDFKSHPLISKYIKNAKPIEYAAHLIPETTPFIGRLFSDGLLLTGDAGGFVLNTGFNLEGANLAIASGAAAAQTVVEAKKKGDFSKEGLSVYLRFLEEWGVLSTLRRFQKAPESLRNPRLYKEYPKFLCSFFEKIYTVGKEKRGYLEIIKEELRKKIGWRNLIKDFISLRRAIG